MQECVNLGAVQNDLIGRNKNINLSLLNLTSLLIPKIEIKIFWQNICLSPKKLISSQYVLNADNTRILSFWTQFPYDIRTDFYMWNISNPSEVLNGDKPRLQQERRFSEYSDKGKLLKISTKRLAHFLLR